MNHRVVSFTCFDEHIVTCLSSLSRENPPPPFLLHLFCRRIGRQRQRQVNLSRWLNTELISHTFPRLLVITNPSHVSFGCLALFVPTIVSK